MESVGPLFQDHLQHPRNGGRPPWFSLQASTPGLTIYLDIDLQEKIREFHYEFDGDGEKWRPYLSALSQMLPGKLVDEVMSWGAGIYREFFKHDADFQTQWAQCDRPLVSLPLFLLQQSLEDFLGWPAPHHDQKGQREQDLVCRCFGVYGKEIQEVMKENPAWELRDITRTLKAGGGCSGCVRDIQRIIFQERYGKSGMAGNPSSVIPLTPVTEAEKIELTPVQLTLKAQPLIDAWVKENRGEGSQVDIMKILGKRIYLRITPPSDEILPKLAVHLRGLFGSDFLFLLAPLD